MRNLRNRNSICSCASKTEDHRAVAVLQQQKRLLTSPHEKGPVYRTTSGPLPQNYLRTPTLKHPKPLNPNVWDLVDLLHPIPIVQDAVM